MCVPLVWDTFLSLYDTVVDDRGLVGPRHPLARLLFAWEWLALRAADLLLVDTTAHGRWFARRYGIDPSRIEPVLVGAEIKAFYPLEAERTTAPSGLPYRVLFYGQFIPLHGMDTIVHAARLCASEDILWDVIGDGQETDRFRRLLDEQHLRQLDWSPWVPYESLIRHIHDADLCLGIFGASDKAARVIPRWNRRNRELQTSSGCKRQYQAHRHRPMPSPVEISDACQLGHDFRKGAVERNQHNRQKKSHDPLQIVIRDPL